MVDYEDYEGIEMILITIIVSVLITNITLCSMVIHRKMHPREYKELESNYERTPVFTMNAPSQENLTTLHIALWTMNKTKCFNGKYGPYCEFHYIGNDIYTWKEKFFYSPSIDSDKYKYSSLIKNSVRKGEKCKEGYKQCGIIDTMDNILCLEESDECPINYIVRSNSMTPPEEILKYSTYDVKLIEKGTYFFYTNEAIDNYVISQFSINTNRPCLTLKDSCDKEYGDEKLKEDERYRYLDSMNKHSFYREHGFFGLDMDYENKEDLLRLYNVSLYYRPFIGYDLSCVNDSNFYLNKTYRSRCKTARKLIIVALFFDLVQLLAMYLYPFKSHRYACSYKDAPQLFLLVKIIQPIFTSCFVIGALVIHRNENLMGCGDKFTEALMSEMTKIKKTQEKYEIAMIAISLLLVVLFFIDDVIYGLLENKEIFPCWKKFDIRRQPEKTIHNNSNNIDNNEIIELNAIIVRKNTKSKNNSKCQ